MNTRDTTLQQLISPEGHGVPDQAWSKILLNPAVIAVLASFSLDSLDAVKTEIRNSIGTLFKMSLLDVLVMGWKKYDDVSQAVEKSKQTPKDTILKSLANHTFKSVQHPYIALYRDDTQVGKIEFESTVALDVEGVQLKIQNGEITGILTGSCQGSVKLALAGETLSEAQTGPIALPGSIAVAQTAPPTNASVTVTTEQRGLEQTKTEQVAPPLKLPEPGVQKQVAPPPKLPEPSVQKQVAPPPKLPEPGVQKRAPQNPLKAILLIVGVVVVLCVCASVALFLVANLGPKQPALVNQTNAPVLAPTTVRPAPTSAPNLGATAAPAPTSAPSLAATAAPAPTTAVVPGPTVATEPTLITPPSPAPTVPAAPTLPVAVLPTATAVPTLPPPGLYVTSMGMDQAQPVHGQLVNFTVSFLNTTGGDVGVKWRVYIYRADTPNRSTTDSTPVQATIHPGPTLDQPVPMNFKLGSTGNNCDNLFARVDTLDSSNKPTDLTTTDGKVFQKDFSVCN